jgi:N-acetylmuramoyl-L-alanine amidase
LRGTFFIAAREPQNYTEEALVRCLQLTRVPLLFCYRCPSLRPSSRAKVFLRTLALCLCVAAIFPAIHVLASTHRQSVAAFARAEASRRRLDAKPFSSRTRADYERTLEAYRSVYHRDPSSPDAARAVAAVADLLASEGRCFQDRRFLHDAVAQWKFLRQQYPGSGLRERALLEEAVISQRDLDDHIAARRLVRLFLAQYPHSDFTEQEREVLRDPSQKELADARMRGGRVTHATPRRDGREETSFLESESAQLLDHAVTVKKPAATAIAPSPSQSLPQTAAVVENVRYWAKGNSTRIAVDFSGAAPCRTYPSTDGKQITLICFGSQPSSSLAGSTIHFADDENLLSVRVSALTADQTALVLDLNRKASVSSFQLANPARWIVDLNPPLTNPTRRVARLQTASDPSVPATHASSSSAAPAELGAPPTTSASASIGNQNSLSRVLGLRIRRIVIDAGHGGHDSGTLGPGGIEEKNIALDVALRLGRLLHQRLGANVIYTRRMDTFVPLEERTAIANQAHADLFISIHANSSADTEVRGVETYYLNFTSSPDELAVAARENATSNRSVYDLSDLVRKITLSDKVDESREFANDVQQSLYGGLAAGNPALKDRGVKQAPFVVLIGAHMPSILAEISFLTNPEDAYDLSRPAYRERIAEDLYRGVAAYVQGMSGVRVAKTQEAEALPAPAE